MALQACVFSESSVVETGLWCELTEGIDPLQWANLCHFLGHQPPGAFSALARLLLAGDPLTPPKPAPRRFRTHAPETGPSPVPLVSLGPSGIGGPCQKEHWG